MFQDVAKPKEIARLILNMDEHFDENGFEEHTFAVSICFT